jgi:hypothetical protein
MNISVSDEEPKENAVYISHPKSHREQKWNRQFGDDRIRAEQVGFMLPMFHSIKLLKTCIVHFQRRHSVVDMSGS